MAKRELGMRSLSLKVRKYLKRLGVAVVYLYGSEALGRSNRLSDFDVGIVFRRPSVLKRREHWMHLRSKLMQCFDSLLVQGNQREIDLVFLQTASPVLQFEAINAGRVLFAADPVFRADYEARVIRDYLDIRPLVEAHYQAVMDRAA